MTLRRSLFALASMPLVGGMIGGISGGTAGCTQPWNSKAADGVKNAVAVNEHAHSRHVGTPPIEISSGTGRVSSDPCERLRFLLLNEDRAAGPLGMFTHECAISCHPRENPGQGLSILDVAKLVDPENTAPNGSSCGAGARYIIPGDPDNSCIYRKMLSDYTPPPAAAQTFAGTPDKIPYSMPATASEASLVYSWIANCLGAVQAPPPTVPKGGA